jgi:hypothetical protein
LSDLAAREGGHDTRLRRLRLRRGGFGLRSAGRRGPP